MKKTLLCSLLLASIAFSGCTQKELKKEPIENINTGLQNSNLNYENSEESFFITDNIPAPSLKNNKLADPDIQPARVFLPISYYKTQKRYPVVYYLHGFGSNYIEVEWYKDIYKKLIKSQAINEFILVGINAKNRFDGSFYVNSPVTGNWEDYVVKDVISFIDTKYRTLAQVSSRGICGFSMGGFGAINASFHHSDVFSCMFAISPAILDNKDVAKVLKTWTSNMVSGYVAAFSPNLNNAFPYSDIPKFDNSIEDNKVVDKLINGIGNLDLKVKENLNSIKKLTGLQIEYGSKDSFDWIPDGCKLLSNSLNENKINNKLVEFEGSHGDKNTIVVEKDMFPFFSKLLEVQK